MRVPLDHNPDESSHRDYVRLLVEQKGLVMFVPSADRKPLPAFVTEKMQAREAMTELPEGAPSRDETHQPPLYYALAALVFALTGGGSLLALRLVALPFQLATVWVAWKAGRDLFPKRTEMAPALAAFVAFLPTQAQLGGAISNDAPTHFFCALILWRVARFFTNLPVNPVREGTLLGLLLGLGLLTKLTVLQLYPVLLVACLWRRLPLRLFLLALALGLLLAAPWLVRNQMLYGDFLAQTIYKATGPNFEPGEISQLAGWSGVDYARNVGLRSLASFWYFLDPNLPLNPDPRQPSRQFVGPPQLLLLALTLALLPLFGLYKASKEKTLEPVLGFAALVPLCLVPFFVKFVSEVFQAQGRYFLPSLLAVALVCVGGSAALSRNSRATFAPAALLLVLALWQLVGGGYAASR